MSKNISPLLRWLLLFIISTLISTASCSLIYSYPSPTRALWVWDAEVIRDYTKQDEFFTFCAQKNIRLIYQDVGDAFMDEASEGKKVSVKTEALAKFIFQAHKKGIKVHALDGDAPWAYAENHQIPLKRLQRALEFNKAVQPGERLDGFQFDIEPYLLKEFKAKGAKWQNILVQYLSLASQIQEKVKASLPSFELGFAIPFWWDVQDTSVSQVTWKGVKKPVAYHLIDILDALPQAYVAIMAYRDFASGPDGSIRHSSDEMKYVKEHAQHVKVFIGQETGDVPPPEPPKITFWQEGEAALARAETKLKDAFKDYTCFAGVAIHHYDSYRQLKAGEAVTSVTPTEEQAKPPPKGKKEQPQKPKKFALLSPKRGDTVDRFTTVSGTGPPGYKVTLSVYPYGDIWYPQQGEAVISADGTWELPCIIGNASTPKDYRFKIRAFLKDEQGKEISRTELDYVMR